MQTRSQWATEKALEDAVAEVMGNLFLRAVSEPVAPLNTQLKDFSREAAKQRYAD